MMNRLSRPAGRSTGYPPRRRHQRYRGFVTEGAGSASVDPREVAKFSKLASDWWRPDGHAAPLHQMNPVRVSWIRNQTIATLNARGQAQIDQWTAKPFQGLNILDVGSGGGLLSESLARLGGEVTGVDVAEENIQIARTHAALDPALINLQYKLSTIEDFAVENKEKFDVVCSMEVIEHVADVGVFLDSLVKTVKPNGQIFLATMNRTPQAYALAIVAAEYLLRYVPPGTHDWNKFLQPAEVTALLRRVNCNTKRITGLHYNPLFKKWNYSSDTSVNYLLHAEKGSLAGEAWEGLLPLAAYLWRRAT